jgi:hypothetical protein
MSDGSSTQQVETHVFNMPKLMGSVNRKSYHNVDSQGNVQLYTIGMKLYGTKAEAFTAVAPNTYYVRRAIKAWHDARDAMFKRAGISLRSLGYARNLRPYLDVNHENGTTTEIDGENHASLGISPAYTGDEWTYSRAAASVPQYDSNAGPLTSWDFVDSYSFTILGDSVDEATTGESAASAHTDQESFVSVGMVAEWLDSFKKSETPAADVAVDTDNALLQLQGNQGLAKEEVLEIAADNQAEGRPWDLAGAQFKNPVIGSYCRSTGSESSYAVFMAPCGLFNLTLGNSAAAETIDVEFEVLDISDM